MRKILDDHGIEHVELEFLVDWWFKDGERKSACDERKRLLFDAARALRARHVKVGDFVNTPCPMSQLIDSFAALCAQAAEYGTSIQFELMPFANIHTLAGALELVQGANAKNGGIIIDLWHVVKLGIPYAEVARIPARFLGGIELNDGFLNSSLELHEETVNHRQLCGEGEFDVRGFVTHHARGRLPGSVGHRGAECKDARLAAGATDRSGREPPRARSFRAEGPSSAMAIQRR